MTKNEDLKALLPCPYDAINNLINNQEQLDMDGCMVAVSRQALDEVLAFANNTELYGYTRASHLREEVQPVSGVEVSEYELEKLVENYKMAGIPHGVWTKERHALYDAVKFYVAHELNGIKIKAGGE